MLSLHKETESTGFSFADALKGGQKKADNVEPKVASPRADKVEADRNIAAGKNVWRRIDIRSILESKQSIDIIYHISNL